MKTKGTVTVSAPLMKEDPEKLVGKPINDQDGNQIGVIMGIDFAKKEWYGEVDAAWLAKTCKNCVSALTMLKEDK